VARRCVLSRNFENEEAKTRYRAVENTTTMGCKARKTNNKRDTGNIIPLYWLLSSDLNPHRPVHEYCRFVYLLSYIMLWSFHSANIMQKT
jgi:hypothetical protein